MPKQKRGPFDDLKWPHTANEESAMRESIRTYGVLQPLIKDADGNTIDGRLRERIAHELGLRDVKVVVPKELIGARIETKRAYRISVNEARRPAGRSWPSVSRGWFRH
jgi:ParB-like chromosome segregation protein Spo0J